MWSGWRWWGLLGVVTLVALAGAYSGPDLPPGPYCGRNNECCSDRRDECAHEILGTLCYCDEFCNRTRSHDDCCPDYPSVCLGQELPPQPLVQPCSFRGQLVMPGESLMDDCNKCSCVQLANLTSVWKCENDQCVNSDQVLEGARRQPLSWRAANYSQFAGKKLRDALVYKLGTFPLDAITMAMGAIHYEKREPQPRAFDARTQWPGHISPVLDQGWCGSDWAVSLAGVASDRFAVQSNGAEAVRLSPQVLLSCNRHHQQGCHGGHIDVAWNFARSHGLVEESCVPYTASLQPCHLKPRGDLRSDGCRLRPRQRASRYRVGPLSRLDTEQDIMRDIAESGPVQAIMEVYQEFFHYRDGVYRRSGLGDQRLQGLHSVRIVGWGEDNNDKYWVVANSWGREWGENGYFRIARGVNEAAIESFVVSVLVDVTEASK